MCNAKPGTRCMGDSTKSLNKKYENLAKFQQGKDLGNLDTKDTLTAYKLRDEINDQKVALFATREAQLNPEAALETIKKGEAKLPPGGTNFLEQSLSNEEARRAGHYLYKYQKVADEYRKNNPEKSQVEAARFMDKKGVDAVNAKAMEHIETKRRDRIAELTGTKAPNGERDFEDRADVEAAYEEYTNNMIAIEQAHDFATADARGVLLRDMDKNTKSYMYDGVASNKHRVDYRKNIDGSFTISTSFVNQYGNDYESIVDSTEDSFDLEDVQITTSPNKELGGWNTTARYVYVGSENLEDAKKFQRQAFKGTPAFRDVLAEIKRVSELPPIR